jgi:stearoyl-CoA desaturase (delta-9 desaturase)
MASLKEQLEKAAIIGVAAGSLDFAATSGWMHRSLTHKSFEPAKPIKAVARTTIWGTGVIPRVWAAVHRDHHAFADTSGDPHSPVLQGKFGILKIMAKNPFLYREAASRITDEALPEDLQPDIYDKKIFDKTNHGLAASLVGHATVNRLAGNPVYMGLVSFGVEKAIYLAGGNAVNAVGHGGKHPFKAMVTGEIEANDDGTYGADSALVGALTLGEGMQRYHHEHPDSMFFGPADELTWPERTFRDPVGALALTLVDHGLAKGPEPE